jgi:dihydrofolate reductase
VSHPRLSLVAAVATNGVIGRDNKIPWRLPSDLKRFKALTIGNPVVMGRKTFQSIGRPLPSRVNIVVSRGVFDGGGALAVPSLAAGVALAAERAGEHGEIFVIGGAEIYRETMASADRLYITEVEAAPAGDAYFPEIDQVIWREVLREDRVHPEGDSAPTAFVIYDRADSLGG